MNDSETPFVDAQVARHTSETDKGFALLDNERKAEHAKRQVRELLDFARRLERLVRVQHEALQEMHMALHDQESAGVEWHSIIDRAWARMTDATTAHASLRAELESR